MGFLIGFAAGIAVGVLPQTRGIVYAQYAKFKAYARRKGWLP